jgi:hypothetical protein
MWRRRAALGVLGLWGLVSLARLSRLVEPPEPPPGEAISPALLDFFRATIPPDAGYLFVLPGEFGEDTGEAPRLRYELYPRRYDDLRSSADETRVRQLMLSTDLRFIVVPDARSYSPTSFVRQPRDWLRRFDFDADKYVLELAR